MIHIIVFIILTLALGGYLVFDKVLNKEENSKCKEETCNCNNQVSDNEKEKSLPEWATYVLNQDITSITYENGKIDENGECQKPKTLTKAQLSDIFEKMTASSLSLFELGGAVGPCNYEILIKYNGKELRVYHGIGNSTDDESNDAEVISLLKKEEYDFPIPNVPYQVTGFRYSWDASYIDTLVK